MGITRGWGSRKPDSSSGSPTKKSPKARCFRGIGLEELGNGQVVRLSCSQEIS